MERCRLSRLAISRHADLRCALLFDYRRQHGSSRVEARLFAFYFSASLLDSQKGAPALMKGSSTAIIASRATAVDVEVAAMCEAAAGAGFACARAAAPPRRRAPISADDAAFLRSMQAIGRFHSSRFPDDISP